MDRIVTTFADEEQFLAARKYLGDRKVACEVVSASPAYRKVGTAALVVGTDDLAAACADGQSFVCSGWVEYRPSRLSVPAVDPPEFDEDIFGRAAVVVLAPCCADETKIRVIAYLTGDLTEVFPYLNSAKLPGSFNAGMPVFAFYEGYRMVCLYPRKVTIAKADDLVDVWRVLEDIRQEVNSVWRRRQEIAPSYEMRQRPPAIEIFKRLPGTNCGVCGEHSCLAFAVKVWESAASPRQCLPVFDGDYRHLKDALLEVCAGLGVST